MNDEEPIRHRRRDSFGYRLGYYVLGPAALVVASAAVILGIIYLAGSAR